MKKKPITASEMQKISWKKQSEGLTKKQISAKMKKVRSMTAQGKDKETDQRNVFKIE